MKKLGVLLCVILVAISMSACQTFNDDATENYPQNNPLNTTIFLQIKAIPLGSTADLELTKWLGAVRSEHEAITDETATKITQIEPRSTMENENTYAIDLTIQNAPASTLDKHVRPFKMIYTQTVFNPIALLPDSDVFLYIVGYSSERRHSDSNAVQLITDDNGEYVYLWTNGETIEFVDIYPNRPLYYLLTIAGAIVIGVLVFIVSRYNDCKKRKKLL